MSGVGEWDMGKMGKDSRAFVITRKGGWLPSQDRVREEEGGLVIQSLLRVWEMKMG